MILIALCLAAIAGIVYALDRWLSRPFSVELMRFPGNDCAIERYLYRRRRISPQVFLPTDVGESRSKEL